MFNNLHKVLQNYVYCRYIDDLCVFQGVLSQLEKLQESLLQCRAALVEYAEGQRAKCHWFHFLPLDDVLQFVCYGQL